MNNKKSFIEITGVEILEKYIQQHGLYHVFLREQDPSTIKEGQTISEGLELQRTFFTQQKAADWILKHGRTIILEEEINNRSRPCVLVIIHYLDNEDGYYAGDNPSRHHSISEFHKYPTFSFTEEGRKMLFNELYSQDGLINFVESPIPYWIYHIDDNNIVHYGFTKDQFIKNEKHFTFDTKNKAKRNAIIDKFLHNPVNFVAKANMPYFKQLF